MVSRGVRAGTGRQAARPERGAPRLRRRSRRLDPLEANPAVAEERTEERAGGDSEGEHCWVRVVASGATALLNILQVDALRFGAPWMET